ncbi:hypothetical protein [Photobacterium kasasachensis]|uniref:hypothetical protein n=1 Tax=Photobacterium kasasachensis TaxID=2910240 RepID=UPI003D106D4B
MMFVISLIRKHSGLINYTLLNIIDKGLIFCIPLIVLFLVNDVELFNKIEYIYSLSAFLVIFLDFGVKNYLFYGYRNSNNRCDFLAQTQRFTYIITSFYIAIVFLLAAISLLDIAEIDVLLFVFVFIRVTYSMLTVLMGYFYRLINTPSKIFNYTITVSILTMVILAVYSILEWKVNLLVFFTFYIAIIIAYCTFNFNLIKSFDYLESSQLVKSAIRYSYPLMINLVMVTVINQFGKVYAYNFLSSDDMMSLSVVQRITLIITLVHSSILGYFSKNLFVNDSKKSHYKIFSFYFALMLLVICVILALYQVNSMFNVLEITISNVYLSLMLLATLLWCITAYFEVYYNKFNKNKLIPLITSSGFIAFFMAVLLFSVDLELVITAMFVSNFVSFIVSITLLYKHRDYFNET